MYKGQSGAVTDPQTGFVYCWHRFYDPLSGRWLTRDPIGLEGGVDSYLFCGGDPVDLCDPTGLDKVWLVWRPVIDISTGKPIVIRGRAACHCLIVVKNKTSGAIWVIEGGPDFLKNPLEPTLEGGKRLVMDGKEYANIMHMDRMLLADDDDSGWVKRLLNLRPSLVTYRASDSDTYMAFTAQKEHTWIRILIGPRGNSSDLSGDYGNSNSWIHELLLRAGFVFFEDPPAFLPLWNHRPDPWTKEWEGH